MTATASFFFQAEDGIRDRNVTGVQTCALPICSAAQRDGDGMVHAVDPQEVAGQIRHGADLTVGGQHSRSEERRVGKECRSRGSPNEQKKKEDSAEGRRTWPRRYTDDRADESSS